MGIYSDGIIYGVSITVNNVSFFEKTYSEKMNRYQFKELKEVYDVLTNDEKERAIIRFYTSCSSTLESVRIQPFMSWFPGTKEMVEKLIDSI
jgi:hypothetical protein